MYSWKMLPIFIGNGCKFSLEMVYCLMKVEKGIILLKRVDINPDGSCRDDSEPKVPKQSNVKYTVPDYYVTHV